jgi:hypothetical protein
MPQKLPFKYYAIRVSNSVIFRRTVKQLTKVKSEVYSTASSFRVTQISYCGGKIVATMPYIEWSRHGGKPLNSSKCIRITREEFRGLVPFMQKSEEV